MEEGVPTSSVVSAATDEIFFNEAIYRRLLHGGWFKSVPRKLPVSYFRPRPKDKDGLSVNRSKLISAKEVAPRPDKPEVEGHVAEFPAEATKPLGLSLRKKANQRHISEYVIPEMNGDALEDPLTSAFVETGAIGLRDASKLIYEAPPEKRG